MTREIAFKKFAVKIFNNLVSEDRTVMIIATIAMGFKTIAMEKAVRKC